MPKLVRVAYTNANRSHGNSTPEADIRSKSRNGAELLHLEDAGCQRQSKVSLLTCSSLSPPSMKTMNAGFWVITSGDSESSANAYEEARNNSHMTGWWKASRPHGSCAKWF